MTPAAWYEHVILGLQRFVANRPEDFRELFSDHALIESLGISSILNIPVIEKGKVLGTINILGPKDHFTPQILERYQAAMMLRYEALVQAMKADVGA